VIVDAGKTEVSVAVRVNGGTVDITVISETVVRVPAARLVVTVSGICVVVKVVPGRTVVSVKSNVLAGMIDISVMYDTVVAVCCGENVVRVTR